MDSSPPAQPNARILEVHKQILSITKELAVVQCASLLFYLVHLAVDDSTSGVLYQTAQSATEPLLVMGPPPPAAAGKVIYDVHAIGNPALWWLSTAAILFYGILVQSAITCWQSSRARCC